jgi:hypothetical protein
MQESQSKTINRLPGLVDRLLRSLGSSRLQWLLLGFGAALRLREYSLNNALYEDEAALALNVINRAFSGLFGPLDSNQVAPVGFLMLEKSAVLLFGTSEYSLRLFPLLFSLGSLILFYLVAKQYLSGASLLFALGLFASAGYLVHYSAQVKQYTADVAIALAITLAALHVKNASLTAGRIAIFGVIGAILLWFSHPSVFVLAGVGSTLCLAALWRRDWRRLTGIGIACGAWLISFACFFFISLKSASSNATLEKSWDTKGTFLPLPPLSLSDFRWFPSTLIRFFTNPLASPFPLLAAAALLLGLFAAYRFDREKLLLLAAPVLFTLAASGIHKYPFGRRLLLFLVPAVVLLVSSGIQLLLTNKLPLQIAGVLLALLLVFKPLAGAASHARWGSSSRDIRTIMSYVRDRKQPGDLTYFYHGQRDAFHYYSSKLGFSEDEYMLGAEPPGKVRGQAILEYDKTDLDRLRGRGRVWLVFSNVRTYKDTNEETFMCSYVDEFGMRLEQHKHSGVAAYLFDTSGR